MLNLSESRPHGRRAWDCRCECGTILPVTVAALTSGNTKSCGCLQPEKASALLSKWAATRVQKRCKHAACGREYFGTHKQIYCSRACKEAAVAAPRAPKACENPRCGALIPSARRDQRFCSPRCKTLAKHPGLPPAPCPICETPFVRDSRQCYCSKDCARVAASRLKLRSRIGTADDQMLSLRSKIDGIYQGQDDGE